MLKEALVSFTEAETDENASMVYMTFRGMSGPSGGMDILGLMGLMRTYELRSMNIVDSQRDHYIHSINVFAMGICIYQNSGRLQEAFRNSRPDGMFPNEREEFLYVWGLASMFHDMGYPIEIAYNQIRRFLRISCGGSQDIGPVPLVRNLEELFRIGDQSNDALDVMSERLSRVLSLEASAVSDILHGYEGSMYESCRVDHGFFSAAMLLKWMGMASEMSDADVSERIKARVVESATSILLHNFYNHTFTRPPFSMGPMEHYRDPISYLLILCDELQEWNRTVYGAENRCVYPSQCRLSVGEGSLTIVYRTSSCRMASDFPEQKIDLLHRLLDLDGLFPNGFDVFCTCDRSSEHFVEDMLATSGSIPRFYADRILEIAQAIHDDYNRRRRAEHPGETPEYEGWDTLRDDIKLSNLKQAYSYIDKLASIGCTISDIPLEGERISELTPAEVEFLSMAEHDRWVLERRSSGWIYGTEKDVSNRISPYVAPWSMIPENIREYDREAVRNILPILESRGISVYRSD